MQAFQNHDQWPTVKDVCQRLKESGYQALLAGGCVRDLLMNREPHDFDIATNATPDQVEAIFPRALTVGKAFGVTILPYEGFQLEVATFREDLEYIDGRRPEGVRFSTAEEDAKRRDFTVNALFLDIADGKVIDHVNGQADIAAKILRTVGDPRSRFGEDKLRLLRAVRFAAQLDFAIAPETLDAVCELASEVKVVSRERVRDELLKLLQTKRRERGLNFLLNTGLLAAAFPDAAPAILPDRALWMTRFALFRKLNLNSASSGTQSGLSLDGLVLVAIFFEPVFRLHGEKFVRDRCLRDLKLDNKTVEAISFCFQRLEDFQRPERLRRGVLMELLAHPYAKAARVFAQVMAPTLDATEDSQVATILNQSQRNRDLPAAYLGGEDLKKLGVESGRVMGELLREAYLLQLEGALPSYAAAIEWASRQLKPNSI